MEKGDRLLPVAAAVAGNAFWGFSFLFTRVALQETTPELMLALRFMISFALMNIPLLLGRQKLRLKGKKLLPLLGLAVAEPVVFFAESYGILHTNATFAGVMVAIAPIFAIALAALVLKEYPSRRQLLFCLLPVIGVIIMVLSGKSLGVVTPLGVLFLLVLDKTIPHLHLSGEAEGPKARLSKTAMLVLAVVLHNIPEGMAVGVLYAGWATGAANVSLAAALTLSLGIALQNFPEGAIISMPLRGDGMGKGKAFGLGTLSGAVEPVAALVTILLAEWIAPALPYLLGGIGGGAVGGMTFEKVNVRWLKVIFALFLLYGGVKYLL